MDLPRYVSARPSSLFPAFAFLPSTGNSSCASSPPIAGGLGPPPSHRRKTRPYPFPRVPSSTAGGLGPLPSDRRRSQLYPFRASILRPSEDSALLLPTVGEFGAPPSARPLFHRRDTRRSPFRPSGDLTLPLPARPLSHRRRTRPFPFRPPKDSTLPLPRVPFPTAAGFDFFPSDRRRIRLSPLPRVPSPIAGKFDIPPFARHLHLRHSDAAHARSWDARFVRNETRSFLLPAANDRAPLIAGRAFALTQMRPYIHPSFD